MSLFSCSPFWSTSPDTPESFDAHAFYVANIDNDPNGTEKILTGSLQGILRIYQVKQQSVQVEDLLLEVKMDAPIVQLSGGRLGQSRDGLALAVLQPKKLSVWKVMAVQMGTGVAAYYELMKMYEHKLERTAYNMCVGPFGGVYGKDYICVQSLDAHLMFFEQDAVSFIRPLPNSLIPSPICYLFKTDSFIIQNSTYEIECYKYQSLSAASSIANVSSTNTISEEELQGEALKMETESKNHLQVSANGGLLLSGKKLQIDWSVSLGECAIDIQIARFSRSLAASQVDILVLCEHTLFTIKESGSIRLQKRLDYNPSCCIAFNTDIASDAQHRSSVEQVNQHLLIGNFEEFIMLYRDTQLIWASKFHNEVPIALRVAQFAGIRGLICGMTETGHVSVSYLGTDPPLPSASKSKDATGIGKELDYKAMDEEHKRLLKVIRDAAANATLEPTEKIELKATISSTLENAGEVEGSDLTVLGPIGNHVYAKGDHGKDVALFLKVVASFHFEESISEASLSVFAPDGFFVENKTLKLFGLKGSQSVSFVIRASSTVIPTGREVSIVASYVTPNGEPRTSQTSVDIPLLLFSKVVLPKKNKATFFTIDTNQAPVPLNDLFPDMLNSTISNFSEIQRHLANTLTVDHYAQSLSFTPLPIVMPSATRKDLIIPAALDENPYLDVVNSVLQLSIPASTMSASVQDCSILVSKAGGRYRIQGNNLESMWTLSFALIERLQGYFASKKELKEPLVISVQEDLPLAAYFEIIDEHFTLRQMISAWKIKLENLAHQFRSIQKRLLAHFKDKNPAPLKQMDRLMQETYQSLLLAADHLEINMQQFQVVSARLSAATLTMLFLMRYKLNLDDANFEVLRGYFAPVVSENSEIGWEEMVDASISYCLKYGANGKGGRDPAPPTLSLPKDTVKLKKHLQVLVEKLSKGLKLVGEQVVQKN